jgi:hypothetical protein
MVLVLAAELNQDLYYRVLNKRLMNKMLGTIYIHNLGTSCIAFLGFGISDSVFR